MILSEPKQSDMTLTRTLLLAGLGYYAYVSLQAQQQQQQNEQVFEDQQAQQQQAEEALEPGVCPEGYLLSGDGKSCDMLGGENPCPPGYKLSDDGTECVSACGSGEVYSTYEQKCVKDLNISTGSDIGDFAANTAISIGAGLGINTAIQWATTPRAVSAAKAAAKAAEQKAAAAAAKAAETAAAKAASRVAQRSAAKAGLLAARATKIAGIAAKAAKAGSLIAKMANPLGPFSIIITLISQSLIALLDLQPGSFEACKNGEYDLSTLPQWAQAIIGAVPFAGDLFDMFAPTLCFQGGCSDPNDENQNGLCYPKPQPGYKCEAFMCYKQYPEFENNGMLHTLINMTKAIKMDTGTIPDTPPPDTVKSGLLYYKTPSPDYDVVAGVAWQKCLPGMSDTGIRCEDIYGNGIGRIP